ncbi:MAG: phytanoyl-CoA dioxygenase family protein [Acidimicrobiia bacterium]|nr:phytanoyl-CoA dioxygenase family protein [Acidimicrobiia bacterium]
MGEHLHAASTTADEVATRMEADGYAVVEGMLSADEVATIRADLHRVLESVPSGRNEFEGFSTQRIYAVFAKTRALDDAAVHPLLLGVLDRVLGPHYEFSAPVGINIGPGEKAQVLHRDDQIYPLPWPHDEVVVNTMWAFDDFTAANGATRVVPGSHRWDTPDYTDDLETVTVEMPVGSVIFYPGSVLHGGGANDTDRPRLGVILEYVASWLKPQENHILAVAPEVVATLPEKLQELLGYNVYPPFIGNVDGRHPRKTLERRRS